MLNRRLPEITARTVSSRAPFEDVPPRNGLIELTRVETFLGAACLRRISGHARVRGKYRGVLYYVPKQLSARPDQKIPLLAFRPEVRISSQTGILSLSNR
jgi:hypothetical protein